MRLISARQLNVLLSAFCPWQDLSMIYIMFYLSQLQWFFNFGLSKAQYASAKHYEQNAWPKKVWESDGIG